MDATSLNIYNLPPMPPKWDSVGIFYITFCMVWTTLVVCGMAFCWYHRHTPILRIRDLSLAFGSITFLHAYWILAQLTYPIGASMPVLTAYDAQYFVMGIWFPLGIAGFHIANMRFLHVAKSQRQFVNHDPTKRLQRISRDSHTSKYLPYIVVGMIVQTFLCVGMWLVCKKYHPSFGVPGTELRGATLPEQLIDLGRGWEWWSSILWQLLWTWIVAPISIWQAWGVRDTMGWQTQTIGACLSGLHATPMFLIASYVPAFSTINMYFGPSQWLQLNTFFIEIFTIFLPAYQVMNSRRLGRLIAGASNDSDRESQAGTSALAPSTTASSSEFIDNDDAFSYLSKVRSDRLLSMETLTHVLNENPTSLQNFSAFRDFSGENVAFLCSLASWKDMFPKDESEVSNESRVQLYNAALDIYVNFVSPLDAEFPLNLSSLHRKRLEQLFEAPACTVYGASRKNCIAPFSFEGSAAWGDHVLNWHENTSYASYTGPIPEEFGVGAFDDVQEHIKDLILTNTWPKFVKETLGPRQSLNVEESKEVVPVKKGYISRLIAYVRSWM